MATRSEHVRWCKQRALEYIEAGEGEQAYASMVSDMHKHAETAELMAPLQAAGMFELMSGGVPAVRRWIEGFPG